MRISRPSSPDMLAMHLLAIGLAIGVAQAQSKEPDQAASDPSVSSATTGDKAMDALARARAKVPSTQSLPEPSGHMPRATEKHRRRAFEALRSRITDQGLEDRARAAQTAGQAILASEQEEAGKRIAQALGLEAPSEIIAATRPTALASSWVPVLFASSSMPLATLRAYVAQLEKTKGVLAFRGMPGGLQKVGPMARLSAQILRRDAGCEGPACAMRDVQLIVDPILFRQHGVNRVPALALLPGDPTQPYCEREEEGPASARAAHLVYGDTALSGMLEAYARLGGEKEVRDAETRLEAR